jgi:hypothetical protein
MAHRVQLILAMMLGGTAVAACGIGVTGVESLAVGPDGGVVSGGGGDGASPLEAGVPLAPPDCSKSDCPGLTLAAAGFTPIGFGAASEVCPGGFDSTDGFGDPKSRNGSCGCGTCTTTGSTCNTGDVPSSQSDGTSCAYYGAPFEGNSGKCVSNNGYWGSTYGGVDAPKAVVGTCHADGQVVRENIDVSVDRVCTPRPGTCPAALCSLGTGLKVCLVAPGDVPCPSVAPSKRIIGDLKATCDACSCTPVATCGGKLHWWEVSTTCTGAESGTVPAAVCTKVNNKNINSYQWEGTVASETCASVVPAMRATVAREGLKTVCCPG